MDEFGVILIAIIAIIAFVFGIWLGVIMDDNNIQSHCKDYGKHASGDWILTCAKK